VFGGCVQDSVPCCRITPSSVASAPSLPCCNTIPNSTWLIRPNSGEPAPLLCGTVDSGTGRCKHRQKVRSGKSRRNDIQQLYADRKPVAQYPCWNMDIVLPAFCLYITVVCHSMWTCRPDFLSVFNRPRFHRNVPCVLRGYKNTPALFPGQMS